MGVPPDHREGPPAPELLDGPEVDAGHHEPAGERVTVAAPSVALEGWREDRRMARKLSTLVRCVGHRHLEARGRIPSRVRGLLNHFICAAQQRRRDREAERLGGLEVDH